MARKPTLPEQRSAEIVSGTGEPTLRQLALRRQASIDSPSIVDAIAAERLRCMTIMTSPAGLARPRAAARLAFGSNMSVEQALAFLDDVPAEATINDRIGEAFIDSMAKSADALAVAPQLTATGAIVSANNREARLAELADGVKGFNASRGFPVKG